MNCDYLVFFNKKILNKKDFNNKITSLLNKCYSLSRDDNRCFYSDLLENLDFYYHDYEYISLINKKYAVYLFDINGKSFDRISLDFEENYSYDSIIGCLYEEVLFHTKNKYTEFYLCCLPMYPIN
jgi:hypothetical protein